MSKLRELYKAVLAGTLPVEEIFAQLEEAIQAG